jgi:alkylation response protein AidB-like acyl-CoA dehydrogenase
MDLTFTPAQQAWRAAARAWIAANLPEGWRGGTFAGPDDEDEGARQQRDWERRLHAAGYAGVGWPRAYGGQGLGVVEQLIINEELGRAAAPEGVNTVGMELVGPILLAAGTEEQKRSLIPSILAVDTIWCQGFSEPEAGSDLAAVRTEAVRDGDAWVINGQKLWTTHARHADLCLLLARTDASVPKHRGLTLLIVPMDAPGVVARPLVTIAGRREFAEVFFQDVRVPLDATVGPVNEGWRVAAGVLEVERGTLRLYRQQRFLHEFEHLLRVATETEAMRTRVAHNAHFRQRLAEIYAELAIQRYHNLKLVSRMLAGEKVGAEVSITKLFWSEMHQRLTALAFDVLGPEGVASGRSTTGAGRFQDLLLHCRFETISAGTSQIQRNIIAERMLGLPRQA